MYVCNRVPVRLAFMPRRKKDGDRFRPIWRDRPAKLKDFLRGQGVPLHRREEVALICDEDDVVSAGWIRLFPRWMSLPALRVGARNTVFSTAVARGLCSSASEPRMFFYLPRC